MDKNFEWLESPTPKMRFVEREIQNDANPSLSRNAKILQQEWKIEHTRSHKEFYEWRDVPLEIE